MTSVPAVGGRAVLYLRVSTTRQARSGGETEGYSIPAQRAACPRKAADLSAEVVDEYVDAGASARSADRPALQALLDRLIEQRDIDYVIVHKIDRLARDRADDVAIVRLEQLYPIAHRELSAVLARYEATDIRWVQEEPANQGAWPFLGLMLPERVERLSGGLKRVSRRRMAAPAAGVAKVHEVEQKALIAEALD